MAWLARPAATSMISAEVTENRRWAGMASRPRYISQASAAPPTTPSAPPIAMDPAEASPPAVMPYRNRTISAPSRSTATPITTESATRLRDPSRTEAPSARISCAVLRPCADIQIVCQPSIRTASVSTVA